jgi:uncharacterized protein (TIGR00725 family)
MENKILKVGVMGAAGNALAGADMSKLEELAERLGRAIASNGLLTITGATTGLPDMVSRATRKHGGMTVGISPAANEDEHAEKFHLPVDGADVIIYTGFGLKGRNVVNIRSSDIVIIFGGGMGTLNEFTIAYDEGKVIGVLTDSGGVADHIPEIIGFASKPTSSIVVYDSEPERLIDACIKALKNL